MTFLDDFSSLLPDTVTVTTPTSTNINGETLTSTSPAASYPARVMQKATARRTLDGEEFVSPLHIIIATSTPIPLNARVVCPDGVTRPVASADFFRDENNLPHHATVYFS